MAYPGYLIDNLLLDLDFDTDVISSSEDADYPLENLTDRNPANVFKFESEAGGYIEFDLGSSVDIDTCALINHSFDTGDGVVVKAGAAPTPTTTIMEFTHQLHDMYVYLSTPETVRYVRLEWDGAEAIRYIGELVLGEMVLLTSKFLPNPLLISVEEKISRETLRGVHSAYDMFAIEKKFYQFISLTVAQKTELKILHQAAMGDRYPFLWVPDVSKQTLLYGYKQPDFEMNNAGINRFNFDLSMTSASRGD